MKTTKPKRMRDINRTFSSKWIGPFESSYCILQKFTWQNYLDPSIYWHVALHRMRMVQLNAEAASGRCLPLQGGGKLPRDAEFDRFVGGAVARNGSPSWVDQSKIDFINDDWFTEFAVDHQIQLKVEPHLFSRYRGAVTTALADFAQFRFCPACLIQGYHSFFYQIAGLRVCPIHLVPLVITCQSCGHSTSTYSLWRTTPCDFENPFLCTHCKKAQAGSFNVAAFFCADDLHTSAKKSMLPLHDWLTQLSTVQWPQEFDVQSLDKWFKYWSEFSEKTCTRGLFALNLAEHFIKCPLSELFEQINLDVAVQVFAAIPHVESKPFDPVLSHLDIKIRNPHRIAIYKSIKRQAVKRLHAQGHRRCLRITLPTVRHSFSRREFVQLTCDVCPVAQAFVVWRMGFEAHLTDRLALRLQFTRWTELSINQKFRQISFDMADDDRVWAWITMNSFFGKCAVMRHFTNHVISKPSEKKDHPTWGPNSASVVLMSLNVLEPPFSSECFITSSPGLSREGEMTVFGFSSSEFSTLVSVEATLPKKTGCNTPSKAFAHVVDRRAIKSENLGAA